MRGYTFWVTLLCCLSNPLFIILDFIFGGGHYVIFRTQASMNKSERNRTGSSQPGHPGHDQTLTNNNFNWGDSKPLPNLDNSWVQRKTSSCISL